MNLTKFSPSRRVKVLNSLSACASLKYALRAWMGVKRPLALGAI